MTAESWAILIALGVPMAAGVISVVYVGARGIEAVNGLKRSVDELREYMKKVDDKVDNHSERLARLEGSAN